MNLSDLILLNFLAWIRISATINPHKVEVSNINGITENCSDKVKLKLTYPKTLSYIWLYCLKKNHDGVG